MGSTKAKILIFFIATVQLGHSQYGADGVVAAGAHLGLWAAEKEDLETILDTQDYLISANVLMALEEAKLVDISKKKYRSLSTIDEDMSNALTLAQIVDHGARLYEIQDEIYDIIEPYPEVSAIITPSLIDLIVEQAFLINDIGTATTEGQANLMNSSERFVFMRTILAKVDAINDLAIETRSQARTLISLVEFELGDYQPLVPVNYNQSIQRTMQQIEEFIEE